MNAWCIRQATAFSTSGGRALRPCLQCLRGCLQSTQALCLSEQHAWLRGGAAGVSARPGRSGDGARRWAGRVACSAKAPRPTPQDLVKRIGRDDVITSFARSGGAGGQNVNKVNTKVDMRISLKTATWLSPELHDALTRLEKKRINKEGELVVTSTLTRSQQDNLSDALEKMQGCLDRAAETLIPPEVDEEKVKQIAKQKKAANENRLQDKKKAAFKKSERRAKIDW